MQKIIPNLWFDRNIEEAVAFYTSTFDGGVVRSTTYYSEVGHEQHGMEAGDVLSMAFSIEGYEFMGINGGPYFTLNPAISFFVQREQTEEIDALWAQLTDGGTVLMPLQEYPFSKWYGWVQDRFGVSWQLILANPEGDRRPILMPSFLFTQAVNGRADEAMRFYTDIFDDAAIGQVVPFPSEPDPAMAGMLMYGDFTIAGQWFAAMDGGAVHDFTFTEAISLQVICEDQAEIDRYWDALAVDPTGGQCGWLKDRFGVSWQIVPAGMEAMLNDPDKEKADRVMAAMLQMRKIDMAALQAAQEKVT